MRALLTRGLVCLLGSGIAFAGVISPNCEDRGKTRLLSVGISRYDFKILDNRFAAADAAAIADAFHKIGAEPTILTDKQATRAGIRDAIVSVGAQSTGCDTLIFFFAGLGDSRSGEYYLFPSDSPSDGDLRKTALAADSLWDLLQANAADYIEVILDTNDASDFFRFSLDRLSRKDDLNSRAISILGLQGIGYEVEDTHHGVLSDAVLRALNPAFDVNGDGRISAAELEVGVASNILRAQAGTYQGDVSFTRARAVSRGRDFVLGKVGPPSSISAKRGITTPDQEVATDAVPAPKQLTGKYTAWLIATDVYDHTDYFPKLNNPIRDADAVEERLARVFGFDAHHLHNPKVDDLDKLLTQLSQAHPNAEDELFLYIAGHGYYDPLAEIGYIVASDSDNRPERTMFSENRLMTSLKNLPWKHVFLVIDACQAGAILTQKREIELKDPHLEHVYKPGEKLKGLLARTGYDSYVVLTSGGNDFVDDGINHSPFAEKFLEALDSAGAIEDQILLPNDIRSKTIGLDNPAPVFEFHLFNKDPRSEFWFIADPKLRGDSGASHQ